MDSGAIGIEIAGQFLEMDEAVSLDLVLISPLFSDELGESANSHSYRFTVPWTPKNQKMLLFRDSVLKERSLASVDCVLWIFGSPWKAATLLINLASRSRFELRVEIEASRISRLLGDKTLRDYDYDGERLISSALGYTRAQEVQAHANSTIAGGFDYVFFPVENQIGYAESNAGYHRANPWIFGTFAINYDGSGNPNGSTFPNNRYYLIPFPFLQYVLKHIIASEDLTFDYTVPFWTDGELQQLVIWNNRAIDEGIVVAWPGTGDNYTINHYAGKIRIKDHVPDYSVKEFLSGILTLFGAVVIEVKPNEFQILHKKTIVNGTEADDWIQYSLEGASINYADLVEGITFGSEQDQADTWCTEPLWLEPGTYEIAGTVPTVLDLPTLTGNDIGAIYLVEKMNRLYEWKLDEESNPATYQWVRRSKYTEAVTAGDASMEVISPISTLTEYFATESLPEANQKISSPLYETGLDNPFSPRLMFFRGTNGSGVPEGSCTDLDGDYNYSLEWHGDRGLYKTWWEDWAQFLLQSKAVNIPLIIRPVDLFTLDWTRRKKFATREGYAQGFLRKLNVRITMTGIQSVDAEIMTG